MKRISTYLLSLLSLALGLVLTASCGGGKKPSTNWMSDYDVRVAIDETFRPIMSNLVESFGMAHPEANMKPLYVSEDSALRLLLRDSLRCAIVTRRLSPDELALVKAHNLGATQTLIATDAIALITNKQNGDCRLTIDEVKGIVSGRITRWEQLKSHPRTGELSLIFDAGGSSTVRYMRDSLCAGGKLGGRVFASKGKTNESVIKMIEADPSLIGVVGANWLGEEGDTLRNDFHHLPYSVVRVKGPDPVLDDYEWPNQLRIATGEYPLLRSVYIIHTDPRTNSLLRQFYFFVKGQKGQTIICNNSQLLPITPVQFKTVDID